MLKVGSFTFSFIHLSFLKNYRNKILLLCAVLFLGLKSTFSQKSINLNGLSDYIAVGHSESLSLEGDFTVEAWIKPNDISGEKTILIKGNNGQCGNYGLFIKDGNLAFLSDGDCNWAVSRGPNAVLQVGVWQHVAAVSNGTAVDLYINGVLTDTLVRNAAVGTVNSHELWIGRSVLGITNYYFNGFIDEVRIWDMARSQTDLQNNMSTELSGLEENLRVYYKLDDFEADCDITDCSINENHGQRVNLNDINSLPQFMDDQPANLTDVACGVVFNNCITFKGTFQLFVDSVMFNLENDNAIVFFNDEVQVTNAIQGIQDYYSNRHLIVDEFYDFLSGLCTTYPHFFTINSNFDDVQFKYLGSFREQVHIYLRDYLRDYPDKEPQFLSALELINPNASAYLKIWNDYEILIIDNFSLSQRQLTVIDNLLATIPDGITDLGVIMFREFYTNNYASAIYTTQSVSAINSFGSPIGIRSGNGFPSDFDSFLSDEFSIALSHEICHTIDFDYLRLDPRLQNWKYDMLNASGTTNKEYLRSKVLDIAGNDFFQVSPQEFFASLANIYFSNSGLTLELAVERFVDGFGQPINQFLLMADVFSSESNQTQFYVVDQNSNLELSYHALERNGNGFISKIHIGDTGSISFLYDENNYVSQIIDQRDDDADGVINDLDHCPNTNMGQVVDERGCEAFSFNAFRVYTEGTACPGTANGLLELSVTEETNGYIFDVQLTGNSIDSSFENALSFNSPWSISDLSAGTYTITVSLDDGYQNIFEQVTILDAEDLSADKTRVDEKNKIAYYTISGNRAYSATVNDNTFYYDVDTREASSIAIPIEKGENTISIKGAECQTVFKEQLFLNDLMIYPNPVKRGFYLNGSVLGNIHIYNTSGYRVRSISDLETYGNYINIQEFPPGVYFMKLEGSKMEYLKILKE